LRRGGEAQAALDSRLEAMTHAHDAAAATARVMADERESMKRDWTTMFVATEGLNTRIEALEAQLAAQQQSTQVRHRARSPCVVCLRASDRHVCSFRKRTGAAMRSRSACALRTA